MDIEKLEHDLKSQDALSVKPGNEKRRKRGHTHKHLTLQEEQQYMVYSMVTDLF